MRSWHDSSGRLRIALQPVSGYNTSAREQLLTLYRYAGAAQQVNLDPETLGGAVSVERYTRIC